MKSALAIVAAVTASPVLGAFVDYNFVIGNVQAAPDGFRRSVVAVNGQIPGTLITANKGDTLRINVTNQLTDSSMRRSTTIHWHGLFQSGTAGEDGPAFVTQCPISQFNSYTYEIPLHDQTGTFWYHSHLSSQYVDGLRGALVVYDPNDPHKALYDVDDEATVITLDDWYHTPAPTLQEQFFSTNNTALNAPVPDSALINGKGRYVGGPEVERAVLKVQSGKRYRFRVINTSAIGSYTFAIEGHTMTIIEADGIAHEPLVVDSFDIYAGQRYSFILEANQTVANYWVSAPMTVAAAGTNANLDATNVYAVLRYEGAPEAEPTTEQTTAMGNAPLVEENLHALINPGAPGGSDPADVVVNLAIGRSTIDGSVAFTFNGVQYKPPTLPTLLQILSNNATVDADFGTDEHTLTLPFNKTIELVITGGANHPIHLHGHVFDVVQSLGGSINYVNPPRRDVVRVSNTGVILRFRTDNPGPWFVHCHIDWHLEAGLAVVFAEAPSEIRAGTQKVTTSSSWDQLCPKYQALSADLQ
ncbi:Multicopper oxidase [Rhizoctonia solani]|uniref:Multicopper oxidase n=1 Tax=Rhizoctonia solani TaxID=456999 RepID=A0A8H8NYL5_9AGAM|nr:Multicopper oxidase [Rhizoctonia solani]QRW22339.1 Multicopper oxidase [Rhizoctonia solani]